VLTGISLGRQNDGVLNKKHDCGGRTNGLEVASRRSPSFSVFRTEHSPGLFLSAHAHPEPCVILPFEGTFWEILSSGTHECSPGSLVVEHPEELHENRFGAARTLTVVIQVHSTTLSRGIEHTIAHNHRRAALLAGALSGLLDAPEVDDLELEHFALGVLSLCTSTPRDRREPSWLRDAVALIWNMVAEIKSISDLAGMLDVSPIQLARRFKECYGVPLWRYIRSARTTAAHLMLRETDLPISAIAADLGYSDQAHLTRDLRRQIGLTPKLSRQ
jgi:AraC-like DNA-binding protein